MATLRSCGDRSLTTRSPMRSVPPLTVSSPASSRSSVDLPQPDGPTKTTSSPSSICSVTVDDGAGAAGIDLVDVLEIDAGHGHQSKKFSAPMSGRTHWNDRIRGEALLNTVVAEVVGERDEQHRLVERQVLVGHVSGARVDGIVEAIVAVDIIKCGQRAQIRERRLGHRRRVPAPRRAGSPRRPDSRACRATRTPYSP